MIELNSALDLYERRGKDLVPISGGHIVLKPTVVATALVYVGAPDATFYAAYRYVPGVVKDVGYRYELIGYERRKDAYVHPSRCVRLVDGQQAILAGRRYTHTSLYAFNVTLGNSVLPTGQLAATLAYMPGRLLGVIQAHSEQAAVDWYVRWGLRLWLYVTSQPLHMPDDRNEFVGSLFEQFDCERIAVLGSGALVIVGVEDWPGQNGRLLRETDQD